MTVNVELPYCDKGEWKKKSFSISFIPAGVYEDYNLLGQEQASFLRRVFGNDLKDKDKASKEQKTEMRTILEKRADLICYILEDNGCLGDITTKWLNRKVEPTALDTFLEECIHKDLTDDKKKAVEKAVSSMSKLSKQP